MAVGTDWFDGLGEGASMGVFCVATVAVLALTWAGFFLPVALLSSPLVGGVTAAVVTAGLFCAAVWFDTPGGWETRARIATYLLGIALLNLGTLAVVWLVVSLPLWLLLGGVGAGFASVLTLALASALAVGTLFAIRDTGPVTDWALNLRMVAALLALVLATVAFLTTAWVVTWLTMTLLMVVFFGTDLVILHMVVASLVTGLLALGFLYGEYKQVDLVERRADATPVAPEEYPEVHATVNRVAAQLDVPVPTVAIAQRRTPEALVVGFRPSRMHLVLSSGTLEALEGDQLTAVIAHELAHVANRDAMVMTVVSLPVILADGLRARVGNRDRNYATDDDSDSLDDEFYDPDERLLTATDDDGFALVDFLLYLVGTAAWNVTRSLVAFLSRGRELTADRTAATVTGSSVLAEALRELDEDIQKTPTTDLREAASVSSLSILPIDPYEPREPIGLGPEGQRQPTRWWSLGTFNDLKRQLFRTHPPTETRLEALAALETVRETGRASVSGEAGS